MRPWALWATVTFHVSGSQSSAASSPVAVGRILRAVYLAKHIFSFTSWLIRLGLKIDQQIRLLDFQEGNNIMSQVSVMPLQRQVSPTMAVFPDILVAGIIIGTLLSLPHIAVFINFLKGKVADIQTSSRSRHFVRFQWRLRTSYSWLRLTRGWPATGDHIWAYLMPYANLLAPCGDLERWTGSGPAAGLKWIGGSSCDCMLRMKAADQPAELVTTLLGLCGLSRGCVIISAFVIRSSNTF